MNWIDKFKHAFAIGYDMDALSDADKAALRTLAEWVCARHMEAPAIMLVESFRPLNFIASQVGVVAEPFVVMATDLLKGLLPMTRRVPDAKMYKGLVAAFEKRTSVDFLVENLTDLAAARTKKKRGNPKNEPEE